MDEDDMMLEIDNMKQEENGGVKHFLESLLSFSYSEVIESLKNYQSLLPHFFPSFATAVPRSLIDMGDIYDLEFVIESVTQFGLMVKGLASDLSTTITLFYSIAILSVVLIGGLYAYAYSNPILASLWVISSLAPN